MVELENNLDFEHFINVHVSSEHKQILFFLKEKYGEAFSDIFKLLIISYLCPNFPARSLTFSHCANEIINYMARQYKKDNKDNSEIENLKLLITDFKNFIPSSELDDLSKKIHGLKQDILAKYRHFNGCIFKQSDFDNIFITINDFLIFLMKNETILDKISTIENILQQEFINENDINILKKCPLNLLKYFFEKCDNCNFFGELQSNNLLSLNGNSWPAFSYLEKVAKKKSKKLMVLFSQVFDKVCNKVNVDESVIYLIVFKLGLKLKDKQFIKISKLYLDWLKISKNINCFYLNELFELINRLNTINQSDLSYFIVVELLKFDINTEEKSNFLGKRLNFEKISKFNLQTDKYLYEQITRIVLNNFSNSIDLFKLLCSIYTNAVIQLSDEQKKEYHNCNTFFIRAAIEYSSQDEYNHSIFYHYISCIRDIAENIFKENNCENICKVIEILKKDNLVFFNRILLYLLYVSDDILYDILKETIFNYDYLANSNYYHEYFLLINKKYNLLKNEDKKAFLDIIDKGLNEKWCKKNNYNFSSDLNIYWKERYILPIKQYLNKEEISRFKDFIKDTEISERDKFNYYHESSVILGYSSPLEDGKLSKMDIEELIKYLNNFEANEMDFSAPSYIGLAEDLFSDVKIDYKKYIINIDKFKIVTKPVYIYYLLIGFRDSNLEIEEWEKIIDFGCWVFEQNDSIVEKNRDKFIRNVTWKETKIVFIDLLNKFFTKHNKNTSISSKFLEKSLNMLSDLSLYEDNNLNERICDENTYDYLISAVNSNFGKIFETLIFYIYWTESNTTFLKDLLNKVYSKYNYLEKFAILGMYIGILNVVIPDWVKEHFNEIFPKDIEKQNIFKASFFTILEYSKLTVESFKLLKSQYEYVVNNSLFIENKNIMERLAKHICSYYIHGDIIIEDNIIQNMLKNYNNKSLRQNLIRLVGPTIRNNSTVTNDGLNKLIDLWKEYKKNIEDNEEKYLDELKYFCFWYFSGKFDSDWILSELCELLEKYKVKFDNWIIWNRLVDDLPKYPDKVFCIIKNLSKEYSFISMSKSIIIDTIKYITENDVDNNLKIEKNKLIDSILSREDLLDIFSWIENLRLYYE